jgi:hypothetical protein
MILTPLILAAGPALAAPDAPTPDLFALRARRVETGTGETLEHAVILIENGKIVTIGEDLPIERGIPVIELGEEQVVMPGIVNAYSRFGMTGSGYTDARPYILASEELFPRGATWKGALENGITTLALYPAGRGIPGQAVAIQPAPDGRTEEDIVLLDSVFLKAIVSNSSTAKRYVSDGFKKADEWLEKEQKNREKYDKAKKKAEEEKDKDKQKAELEKLGEYEPLAPDPKAQAFLDLRAGKLRALFSIGQAADYVHLLDAIGEEAFEWHLEMGLTTDVDFFHVTEKIGERGCAVVMQPSLTLHPGTMRQRNLPAEYSRAGAKLVLIPRSDSTSAFGDFRRDVGVLIGAGLERGTAVRALTLEPATMLGLGDRLGSLEAGKAANLIVLNGDPFEPATKIDAVMLNGDFVHGEVEQ